MKLPDGQTTRQWQVQTNAITWPMDRLSSIGWASYWPLRHQEPDKDVVRTYEMTITSNAASNISASARNWTPDAVYSVNSGLAERTCSVSHPPSRRATSRPSYVHALNRTSNREAPRCARQYLVVTPSAHTNEGLANDMRQKHPGPAPPRAESKGLR